MRIRRQVKLTNPTKGYRYEENDSFEDAFFSRCVRGANTGTKTTAEIPTLHALALRMHGARRRGLSAHGSSGSRTMDENDDKFFPG
jgi:hypothetical protein